MYKIIYIIFRMVQGNKRIYKKHQNGNIIKRKRNKSVMIL